MKDEETRMRIIQLRSEGHSIREVATEMKCSPSTVASISQKYAHEIGAAQYGAHEEFIRSLGIQKRERISRLAQLHASIKEKVDAANWNDLTADKLARLEILYQRELERELSNWKIPVNQVRQESKFSVRLDNRNLPLD